MKIRNVILLILAAFVVTVVARFPVSVVFAHVDTLPVIVDSPEGTVWRGEARRVIYGPNRIDNLGWIVNVLPLLRGQVGADIDFSVLGGDGLATVARALNGDLLVSDGRLSLSAQTLSKSIPGELAQLSGDVDVVVEEWLFVNQQPERLRGDITWRNAALRSPAQAQLGTVTVEIAPHTNGHTAQLENAGGQVSITGKVDVDKSGGYRADVRFKPLANAPADLSGALGLIGRKSADGSYRLRANGRIADFL